MGELRQGKRLRLRRADYCELCSAELVIGQEAIWYRDTRTVRCIACAKELIPPRDGEPGSSALREYERRHQRREDHAREVLGGLGVVLSRVIDEPSSTKVWRQGAAGEKRTAARLAKHLAGSGVRLLHDRQIPGHGHANIDHLAVGPGGITVIDSKTHHGRIRVERVGGLFSPRRSVLLIDGRDRTKLVDGIERQIELIRGALARPRIPEVRGALCFPEPEGLPLLRQLSIREIVIDGPKPIARLAARRGKLTAGDVDAIWGELGRLFPPA